MKLPILCCLLPLALFAQAPANPPAERGTPKADAAPPKPDVQMAKPAASAAKPGETPHATGSEMPPEMKAFGDAFQKRDTVERIAAFEKLLVDFPKSSMARTARMTILDATIREWPGDDTRIRNLIKSMLAAASPPNATSGNAPSLIQIRDQRSQMQNQIANSLANAGVLLHDAERHAVESMKSMKLASYVAEQKENAAKRKQAAPSDAELEKRFKEQVAARQVTLANIYYKQGKDPKAEPLYKTAFDANRSLQGALTPLARYAERRHDDKAAFEYMSHLRLTGGGPSDARTRFSALYTKVKGGTPADAETYLDGVYREQYPNPVHVEPYVRTSARTSRAVLAEVFTGSGCGPCVAADLGFDVALERYSRKDVVVLMYHQHIPLPDPMANSASLARAKYYKVNSVPTFGIDGKTSGGGGGRTNTQDFWNRVKPEIDKRLEVAEDGKLALEARLDGLQVVVRTVATTSKPESDVRLQVALVEESLTYSGENGVRYHPMVVRDLAGVEHSGFKLESGKAVDVTFNLANVADGLKKSLDEWEKDRRITFSERKTDIDRAHIGVVAFLQDEKTKQVLQSMYVPVGGSIEKGTR